MEKWSLQNVLYLDIYPAFFVLELHISLQSPCNSQAFEVETFSVVVVVWVEIENLTVVMWEKI